MVVDGLDEATNGNPRYHVWMGTLTFFILLGAFCYYTQLSEGLRVTGMHDNVSWGLYISNFTIMLNS